MPAAVVLRREVARRVGGVVVVVEEVPAGDVVDVAVAVRVGVVGERDDEVLGVERVLVAVRARVLGDARVSTEPSRFMGSEDFADFLKHAPGAFFTLGHAGTVPAHNPGFIVDDAILPMGATLFARLIESRLKPV